MSPTDPRFKAYSHQASPEKIGIAYQAVQDLGGDVVVSDVSSNTVTLLVKDGRIFGGIDACIFAPGTEHGAIDVLGIRKVDDGEWTANEAFLHAGVAHTLPVDEQIVTQCESLVAQYQADIIQLEDKLASAREKERMLVQRHVHAQHKKRAQQSIRKVDYTSAVARFENLESKIDRMEADAELVNFGRKPGLGEEIDSLATDEDLEAELNALKSPGAGTKKAKKADEAE